MKSEKHIIVDEEFLRDATRKIVEEFDPEKIILFGSYAYGESGKYSDIDLLIIMQSELRPALRSTLIYKLFRPHQIAMDILVRTPEEIDYRLRIGDFFIKEIINKGIILYERRISPRMDQQS